MALSVPSDAEYASFLGIEVADLDAYKDEALQQATDMLQITTGMTDMPTDAFELRVYRNGIAQMAEALTAGKRVRNLAVVPFQSEKIGAYTYERFFSQIANGVPTGLAWFDLARALFAGGSSGGSDISSTGISLFEDEDLYSYTRSSDGKKYLLSPADIDRWPLGMFLNNWAYYAGTPG